MKKKAVIVVVLVLIPVVLLLGKAVLGGTQDYFAQSGVVAEWEKTEVPEGSKWAFSSYSFSSKSGNEIWYTHNNGPDVVAAYITSVGESASMIYANEGEVNEVSSNETGERVGDLVFENGAVTLALDSGKEIVTARYFKDYFLFKNGAVTFCNYSGGDEEYKEEYWENGLPDSLVEQSVTQETTSLGEYSGKKITLNNESFPSPENIECKNISAYIAEGVLYVEAEVTGKGIGSDKVTLVLIFKAVE